VDDRGVPAFAVTPAGASKLHQQVVMALQLASSLSKVILVG